jgi:hypothetical protein
VRLEPGRESLFVSGVDDEHAARNRLQAAGGRWALSEKWVFSLARAEPLLALLVPPLLAAPTEIVDADVCYRGGAAESNDSLDCVAVQCSNGKGLQAGYCYSDNLKCHKCTSQLYAPWTVGMPGQT